MAPSPSGRTSHSELSHQRAAATETTKLVLLFYRRVTDEVAAPRVMARCGARLVRRARGETGWGGRTNRPRAHARAPPVGATRMRVRYLRNATASLPSRATDAQFESNKGTNLSVVGLYISVCTDATFRALGVSEKRKKTNRALALAAHRADPLAKSDTEQILSSTRNNP